MWPEAWLRRRRVANRSQSPGSGQLKRSACEKGPGRFRKGSWKRSAQLERSASCAAAAGDESGPGDESGEAGADVTARKAVRGVCGQECAGRSVRRRRMPSRERLRGSLTPPRHPARHCSTRCTHHHLAARRCRSTRRRAAPRPLEAAREGGRARRVPPRPASAARGRKGRRRPGRGAPSARRGRGSRRPSACSRGAGRRARCVCRPRPPARPLAAAEASRTRRCGGWSQRPRVRGRRGLQTPGMRQAWSPSWAPPHPVEPPRPGKARWPHG